MLVADVKYLAGGARPVDGLRKGLCLRDGLVPAPPPGRRRSSSSTTRLSSRTFQKFWPPRLTPCCLFLPPLISFLLPSCRPYARPSQRAGEGGEGRRERRRAGERGREIAGSRRACQPFLSLGFISGPTLEKVLGLQVSGFGARGLTAKWARTCVLK